MAGRRPAASKKAEELKKEIKQEAKKESKADQEQKPEMKLDAKTSQRPDVMYVKSSFPKGMQINGQINKYFAGQEINDKYLMHLMEQAGVELVDSPNDCDVVVVNRRR